MDDLSFSRWYEVERDMELLARWAPLIEGSSAPLERAARSGRIDKGRGDVIDDRHYELRRALTVHRRLGRLRALPDGERHLVVLRFAFLESGAEWRKRVDPRLDGGGLAEAVGRRFVEPKKAAEWAKLPQRALRKALPRMHGQKLLDGAVGAYARCVRDEAGGER
jgi:hypothetical protein